MSQVCQLSSNQSSSTSMAWSKSNQAGFIHLPQSVTTLAELGFTHTVHHSGSLYTSHYTTRVIGPHLQMDPVTGIAFALGTGSFLLDVFDKSVPAYGLYSTAKSLANVSAHLVAKLLIEERRLIQWGDGVGIKTVAKPMDGEALELDGRLKENDALYQTILQALAGIEETLTDFDTLTAKYGLQVFEERIVPDEISSKNELMLPLRPQRSPHGLIPSTDRPGLSETLRKTQDRSRRMQASTSIRKTFQWAIKDKSGFDMLLDRLSYYNDSLYCLLPKESVNTISRDVLANLIDAATSERLLQYAAVASSSTRYFGFATMPCLGVVTDLKD